MKRIKTLLGILLVLMVGAFTIYSCEKEPEVPACEHDGDSHKYTNIPASGHPESYNGKIEIWIRLTVGGGVWTDWVWDEEYLSPCEEMEYRWYLSSSKSTEVMPLLDLGNGKVGVPTKKKKQ